MGAAAGPGTWSPAPTSYGYQWYRSCTAITGATKATYTLTASDKDKKTTVKVTAKKTGCTSGTATSKAVRVS
ncbi:glycoside hydrolase Chb [Streptomyces sp. NPDC127066]|uniref:glycoside hydrolase Chb n=1 Tax=Streptomyces sp. NPDC127066 TaxID=3347125 RepID=UPI0036614C86